MTTYAKDETEYVVLSRILSEVLSAGDGVKSDDTAYANLWVRSTDCCSAVCFSYKSCKKC